MTRYRAIIRDSHGVNRFIVLTERTAIRIRCLDCCGWDPAKVAECSTRKCALWPHRLCRGPQAGGLRRQAILAYCYWCMDFRLHEKEKCPVRHCPLFIFRSPVVDLSVAIEVDRSWIRQKKLRWNPWPMRLCKKNIIFKAYLLACKISYIEWQFSRKGKMPCQELPFVYF